MTNQQTINYKEHKETIDIRNISALPGGLGCRFLLTIKGPDETLIAKQWKRKKPKSLGVIEVLVCF